MAGYINILFHTCLILLHQPYITSEGKNPKHSDFHQDPVKTCLNAAITITDIAKVTRQLDKNAFCNFQYPIYGIMQSTLLELVVVNGSQEYTVNAKKSFNDSMEELRLICELDGIVYMRDPIKELENLTRLASGRSGNEF